MLLLTGATGSIGSRLLPLLLESGEDVRCLVREPRRLGARRVDVQIALGDLGEMSDPYLVRQALRGVDTVIHLAATIRDQPPRRIEELNGLATVRLLRAAERSGVTRFVFFSALNSSAAQRQGERERYELAGPEVLSYDEMSDLVSRIAGRPRLLVHMPLPLVRAGL